MGGGPTGPIPPWPGVIVAGDSWAVAGPTGPIPISAGVIVAGGCLFGVLRTSAY